MNKICKEYISEVKALFPIKSRQEKEYLRKLSQDIEDYCSETQNCTKKDLYANYGLPCEVVSNYISSADTDYIIKRIRTTKAIKLSLIALLALATITVSIFGVTIYNEYQIFKESERGYIQYSIGEYN